MGFDMLCDVSPASKHWSVCVRVARMWDFCGTRDNQAPIHVDLVLVDEKGNSMYAEIPGAEAVKYKKLIKEHNVYALKKFLVSPNKQAYKPFPGQYMLRFTPWTVAEQKADVSNDFPKHVYHLTPFSDLSTRVGSQDCFIDVLAQVIGVSKVAYIRLSSNSSDTAKRVVALKDDRNVEMKLVLWGERAEEFDAQLVYDAGQESPVIGVFVGMLMKSYNSEESLSGGSPCRWYLNEDLPEIDSFFERLGDNLVKTQWISAGSENFAANRSRANLPVKTVSELRNMDPWEMEGMDFLCTVTIARLVPDQAWWFWSCPECHRSASAYGSEYRCSGGCISPKAYPKYRLCLVGTDGTGAAEFVFFNRFAQQLVGKSVVPLLKSSGVPREIAVIVLQKYTLAISVTEKSLTQRNISFQVNGIEAFLGKQTCMPNETRATPTMPLVSENSQAVGHLSVASASEARDIPELPIVPIDAPRRPPMTRVPLGSTKRKHSDAIASAEGKEIGASAGNTNIKKIGQNAESVLAGSVEPSNETIMGADSSETQATVPEIPPGYSMTPSAASGDDGPVLPAVPNMKKNSGAKKPKPRT